MLSERQRARCQALIEMVRFPTDSHRMTGAEWAEEEPKPGELRSREVPAVRRYLTDVLSQGNLLYTALVQRRWDRVSTVLPELIYAMANLLTTALPPSESTQRVGALVTGIARRWAGAADAVRAQGLPPPSDEAGERASYDVGGLLPERLRALQRIFQEEWLPASRFFVALRQVALSVDLLFFGTSFRWRLVGADERDLGYALERSRVR